MDTHQFIFKSFKMFLTILLVINFTFAADAMESKGTGLDQDLSDIENTGITDRKADSIQYRVDRDILTSLDSLMPLGVIYLVNSESGRADNLQSDSDSLDKAGRIIKEGSSTNTAINPENEGLHSQKRSPSSKADILGQPNLNSDSRLNSPDKPISNVAASLKSPVKQSSNSVLKEINENLSKENEMSKINGERSVAADEISNVKQRENGKGDDNNKRVERENENENNKVVMDDGLQRSSTYNAFSKQKSLNINRIRYHTNDRGQSIFTNSRPTEGAQNLLGTQNPEGLLNSVGLQNTLDSVGLSGRSGNERLGERFERDNLLELGNLIPPVNLHVGLQTGSKYSRRPTPTNELGAPSPIGQNLLGLPIPVRSQNPLESTNINEINERLADESINKPLERALLTLGNPLPQVGLLLGLQTGRERVREPNNLNEINSQAAQNPQTDSNLLTIPNPLPPIGLQAGLHIGKSSN